MSRFFRKARTILCALDEFPRIEIAAFVYPRADIPFLINGPDGLTKVDDSDSSESVNENAPVHASLGSELSRAITGRFTGTVSFGASMGNGHILMNSCFSVVCHGDEPKLFEAIADYAGRGVVDASLITLPDELMLSDVGSHSTLWITTLLNMGSMDRWRNDFVEVFDDPLGRFQRLSCGDALQATWDALSALLLLDSKKASRTAIGTTAPRVILNEQGQPAVVSGKSKTALTSPQHNVVQALLQAGSAGLNKDELVTKSGHADAVKILKRIAALDRDWKSAVQLAGKPGGRYRIKGPY